MLATNSTASTSGHLPSPTTQSPFHLCVQNNATFVSTSATEKDRKHARAHTRTHVTAVVPATRSRVCWCLLARVALVLRTSTPPFLVSFRFPKFPTRDRLKCPTQPPSHTLSPFFALRKSFGCKVVPQKPPRSNRRLDTAPGEGGDSAAAGPLLLLCSELRVASPSFTHTSPRCVSLVHLSFM